MGSRLHLVTMPGAQDGALPTDDEARTADPGHGN